MYNRADPGIPEGGGGGGGGSKIKFMKGMGVGGGVPPPVAGPEAQAPAAFLSFPFIWHEN